MKAQIVIDNRRQDNSLHNEHGFSMYLETEHHKCLVDVGLSDSFLSNAQQLGIDIEDIDYLFLSHGHVDHVGGLPFFLQKNKKARVIVSEHAFQQKYFSTRRGLKDISPKMNLNQFTHRFKYITQDTRIDDDIYILVSKSAQFIKPMGNEFLLKDAGQGMIKDDFTHELVFCFGQEQLMVCSGCAHNGLQNILSSVKESIQIPIQTVIGGFHLLDTDDMCQYESSQEIKVLAHELMTEYAQTQFYTGHCTGDAAFATMKEIMPNNLHQFYVGKEIDY